jgi:hypothetical protein
MTSAINIEGLRDRENWEDIDFRIRVCARRLRQRQLSLALGAGVSGGSGLPNWTVLTDRLLKEAGLVRIGTKDEVEAERVFVETHSRDRLSFALAVKRALYDGYHHDIEDLASKRLLVALGALTMASSRGSVADVITFNFDDLLEEYLRYHGFNVHSIAELPSWHSSADVRVLHPHGLLPVRVAAQPSRGVVLTAADFDEIVGDTGNLWRQKMVSVLNGTFCLFIGLSGDDTNLRNILHDVNGHHSSGSSRPPYWGFRFCTVGDPNISVWEHRGVFPWTLSDYDELPGILLRICQAAATDIE